MKAMMLIACTLFAALLIARSAEDLRPRLLVLTDIGGDPDDGQSLRRLLVYANEFRIEGIIATATWGPKQGRQRGVYFTNVQLIHEAIAEYARVRDNLRLHADGYPLAEELRSRVFTGEANRGVNHITAETGTPGSEHIIATVEASTEPLNISVWGGAHDLAQALFDAGRRKTGEEMRRFLGKITVYAISDQDLKFHPVGSGAWIRERFPTLRYIESGPAWHAHEPYSRVYHGMYMNDSDTTEDPVPLVPVGAEYNDTAWVAENVTVWGPLGAGYPPAVGQGPPTARNTLGVKEGDTPAWFYFFRNGLNDPDHPDWGSWGGRFLAHEGEYFIDAQDDHWHERAEAKDRRKWTVARWRAAYQNDFAARMRWCILPYEAANHPPLPSVNGTPDRQIVFTKVGPGERVILDAGGSKDPDGDDLSYRWWVYREPSSLGVMLDRPTEAMTTVTLAEDSPGGRAHVILEVIDDGAIPLRSYRRIIVKASE